MFKVLAIIAYDGSAFAGFAPQARNSARKDTSALGVSDKIALVLKSVGAVCENIDSDKNTQFASKLESYDDKTSTRCEDLQNLGQSIKNKNLLLSAGRTDKGVHARNMPICFFLPQRRDLGRLREILNAKLYPHIFCKVLRFVAQDFHPRFLALSRTYCYIASKTAPNPFYARFVAWEDYGEFARVKEALGYFRGTHDFRLFCKGDLESKSSVREIFSIYCKETSGNLAKRASSQSSQSSRLLIVRICAQGFLRAQVRLMLGAVFAYGRGEMSLESLRAQIDAKMPTSKIPASKIPIYRVPVSPNGLYFENARYEKY
ncbi:hypothetical protein CQA49_03975 [Helicobacter sp. MIT 00-7814]|uniref:hypothetical protein n=1 Tax=unclassified Helicobacter TaxID=2593540 RepID=UPI000E1FB2F6|nr:MULTISPECIES: hypothetical protein [unclassified Helicobacter]RDU54997.1 hypothetical protein CQA49_03975 [Helicobacter sp. MIT 00-7814]RDU55972.1 hypothetical protein CQA37_03520 [Helicobacter sp. MIT 99-10781]